MILRVEVSDQLSAAVAERCKRHGITEQMFLLGLIEAGIAPDPPAPDFDVVMPPEGE